MVDARLDTYDDAEFFGLIDEFSDTGQHFLKRFFMKIFFSVYDIGIDVACFSANNPASEIPGIPNMLLEP